MLLLVVQLNRLISSYQWADKPKGGILKVDMPILTCIFFTFNWLTLASETHFVKFHPEVASCLLSRGKRKYAPLGMRLLWKYVRNYFLVYQLISHFLLYLQNYKEFEAEILDLQSEKYRLSFDIKKYTTSGWALGDENVIGIRAFNDFHDCSSYQQVKAQSHQMPSPADMLYAWLTPHLDLKIGLSLLSFVSIAKVLGVWLQNDLNPSLSRPASVTLPSEENDYLRYFWLIA